MTIADLKTGAKLVFGNYGVGTDNHPISWLKTGRDNVFISEFVLDILKFDNGERNNPNRECRYYGNSNYELSNILQFMNSYEDDWYNVTHEHDTPPGNPNGIYDPYGDYVLHPGFLHEFEDYELECIDGRIDLPTRANILGTGFEARFPLFNRKGYRGKPCIDLICNKENCGMYEGSFCEFWLRDIEGDAERVTVHYIGRSGVLNRAYPNTVLGMRPICKLKPTTEVELQTDGTYRVVPFAASKTRRSPKICTDEEFLTLMGLL